jgi:hypothetical protein
VGSLIVSTSAQRDVLVSAGAPSEAQSSAFWSACSLRGSWFGASTASLQGRGTASPSDSFVDISTPSATTSERLRTRGYPGDEDSRHAVKGATNAGAGECPLRSIFLSKRETTEVRCIRRTGKRQPCNALQRIASLSYVFTTGRGCLGARRDVLRMFSMSVCAW